MVQNDLERIALIFFFLRQSNIFCTVISQTVVDICGRDRKGRQFFSESWSGDKIVDAVGDIATSPSTKWYSQTGAGGTYTAKGDDAKWVAYETRDGVRVRVVYQPATGKVISAFPAGGDIDQRDNARHTAIMAQYSDGNPEGVALADDLAKARSVVQDLQSAKVLLTWEDGKPVIADGAVVYEFSATPEQFKHSALLNSANTTIYDPPGGGRGCS